MVKISVIIPCYNAEKYLEQCLSSVMNQSLRDIEIICVDDGSSDRTVEMLHEYVQRDSRIQVLCQQNKFAGVARNRGMEAAQGEYFAFLDADDYYDTDGLEKAYAIAKEYDLDMLKLSSRLLDDQTGEITTNAHYSHERFPQKNVVVNFKTEPQKFLNCADVAWNGLYKATFIRNNGICFNNLRCVNDRSFYISCMLSAQRIMVADEYLTTYRRNIAGSLVSVRHKYFDCQIKSYNLIKNITQNSEIDPAHKKMILQHELDQIFIWYDKFLDAGVNIFGVETVIRDFVSGFDIADVGTAFLPKFQRKHHFQRFMNSLAIECKTGQMPENPEISVIVPAYNCVRYLSECIESILLQSFDNFEIICVDDGSSDATAELMDSFACADSRIKVIRQQQAGAGVARNMATAIAKGKYIVYVDSDDKIKSDYLQVLYEAAESTHSDVVITQRIAWQGVGEGYVMRNGIANKRIPHNQVFSCADVPEYILNFTDGAPGGKLFNREFLQRHNIMYLPIKRSEDFYFIFSSFVLAERLCYLDSAGYYYRRNNVASLENTKDETPLLFWDATLTFKEKLQKLGCFETIKHSYLNNTVSRVAFNLNAVKTFEGFSAIFCKLKEVAYSELELDQHEKNYFYDPDCYATLMQMLKYETPGDFLYVEYKRQTEELSRLRRNNSKGVTVPAVDHSVSYRIGRMITFIPRKFRSFLWCVQDHGLRYTIKYGIQKLKNKLR